MLPATPLLPASRFLISAYLPLPCILVLDSPLAPCCISLSSGIVADRPCSLSYITPRLPNAHPCPAPEYMHRNTSSCSSPQCLASSRYWLSAQPRHGIGTCTCICISQAPPPPRGLLGPILEYVVRSLRAYDMCFVARSRITLLPSRLLM